MLRKIQANRPNNGGQSTVEYILLATAVIAAIIVFTQSGGGFRGRLANTLETSSKGIETMGNRLDNSHAATNFVSKAPATKPFDPAANF